MLKAGRAALLVLTAALIANYLGYNVLPKFKALSPIVTTSDGKLEGKIAYSRDGRGYFQYLSIPFAEPPVNDLRYEPPVPLKGPWAGVKPADKFPPLCLQMDFAVRGKLLGKEDCLYLNVFTSSLREKRPVLVWFHGGGFFSGGASLYHPEYFMDEMVVIVTVGYRLGPLGFMNLEDNKITGNMGLKDQNLALKWVQKNIQNFGGDPNQVTISGESAGAVIVQYHMISPASRNLFHKAILQSGAVTMPTAFSKNPKDVAMEYIKNTECSGMNGENLVKCLKSMDPRELVRQQISLMNPVNPALAFLPSVETVLKESTFLSENPRKLLTSGKMASNVPVMIGLTSGEGALKTGNLVKYPELIPVLDKNWEENIANLLLFENISVEKARKIRSHYFGASKFTDNLFEFERSFSDLSSDAIFFEPIYRAALIHSEKYGGDVFMFYYDYEHSLLPSVYSLIRAVRDDDWISADLKIGVVSLIDLGKKWLGLKGPHEFGIPHSNGLMMQWNMEGWTKLFTGPDEQFSKKFVKAMVDFAKNGESLKFDGIHWPSVSEGRQIKDSSGSDNSVPFMLMGKESKIIEDPIHERIRFWQSLNIVE